MVTLSIDVRNNNGLPIYEEDIETLRKSIEITPRMFDYVLKLAMSTQNKKQNLVVTLVDFLQKTVTIDIKSYHKRTKMKDGNKNDNNLINRFRVMELYEEGKFRMIVPMITDNECSMFIVDVMDTYTRLTYHKIYVYSMMEENIRRTRSGINLSPQEIECLVNLDRWLSICLDRTSNKRDDLVSVVCKNPFEPVVRRFPQHRMSVLISILKCVETEKVYDLVPADVDILRLRQHLLRRLPIEDRVHVRRKLGREIYEILSGHTPNTKDKVTGGKDSKRGPPNIPEDDYYYYKGKALPRSEMMYDPNRERDFRYTKRRKQEYIRNKALSLKASIEREENEKKQARRESMDDSKRDPSQGLLRLMSSTSDNEEDNASKRSGGAGRTESSNKKKPPPESNVEKQSPPNDVEEFIDSINLIRTGVSTLKGDRQEEYIDVAAPNAGGGTDPNTEDGNVNNYQMYEAEQEPWTPVARLPDNDAGEEEEYLPVPQKRKRIMKNYLSRTTPDSECFVHDEFFPDADTKLYADVAEAKRAVYDYSSKEGYMISIRKSSPNYILARCISHENCPCEVCIGPVKGSYGSLKVKRIDRRHRNVESRTHGKGGRRLKQRHRVYGQEVYDRVQRNLASAPKPKDVAASARREDGINMSYDAAYQVVRRNRTSMKQQHDRSYQQLPAFLQKFQELNPGSVTDIQVDTDNRVTRVFVCPGIMDESLKYVKRVLMIDACHRGNYGGTLYVATALSANNDLYPIAVSLTNANECKEGWLYFLQLLKRACPRLSEVPRTEFIEGFDVLGFEDTRPPLNDETNGDAVEGTNQEQHVDGYNVEDQGMAADNSFLANDADGSPPPPEGDSGEEREGPVSTGEEKTAGEDENVARLPTGLGTINRRRMELQNQSGYGQERDRSIIEGCDQRFTITQNDSVDDDLDDRKPAAVNRVGTRVVHVDGVDGNGVSEATNGNELDNAPHQDSSEQHTRSDVEDGPTDVPKDLQDGNVSMRRGHAVDEGVNETYYESMDEYEYHYQEEVDTNKNEAHDVNVRMTPEEPQTDMNALLGDMKMMLEYRSTYRWLFVSDRDKGMAAAVKQTFPHVHAANCCVHIRRNVLATAGTLASNRVERIARCFSRVDEDKEFTSLLSISPRAYNYLQEIDPAVWRNTAFMNPLLPPRYGILSSNGVESANNMFKHARDGPWLNALQSILLNMTRRIMKNRKAYGRADPDVLSDKVQTKLYKKFRGASSYEVMETVNGSFIVRYDEDDNAGATLHKVVPAIAVCSCGGWHSSLLPCRHAMAWARDQHDWTFPTVCQRMCSFVHTNRANQQLYSQGIDLVITDGLPFDGVTLPNAITKPSGRGRKQRYRPRSKFASPDESTITCRRCGGRGHNKATCSVPDNKLIGNHSVA